MSLTKLQVETAQSYIDGEHASSVMLPKYLAQGLCELALRALLSEPQADEGGEDAELKPCPFCGDDARYICVPTDDEEDPNAGGEYIECSSCGASTTIYFPVKDSVERILMERWNRRAPASLPAQDAASGQETNSLKGGDCHPRDRSLRTGQDSVTGAAHPTNADHEAAPSPSPEDEIVERCAVVCEQIGTDWGEDGQEQKYHAADYLAEAIRKLKRKPGGETK